MRFLDKKGISPLIATVLLIGFTVALAGVVITWGGGFIKNITSSTEERTESTLACAGDLNFDIKKIKCGKIEEVDWFENGLPVTGVDGQGRPTLGIAGNQPIKHDVPTEEAEIIIDNKGALTLDKIAFRFFDAAGDAKGSAVVTEQVNKFSVKTLKITGNIKNEDGNTINVISDGVTKVEALVTIKVENQDVTCGEAVRERKFTPACTGLDSSL